MFRWMIAPLIVIAGCAETVKPPAAPAAPEPEPERFVFNFGPQPPDLASEARTKAVHDRYKAEDAKERAIDMTRCRALLGLEDFEAPEDKTDREAVALASLSQCGRARKYRSDWPRMIAEELSARDKQLDWLQKHCKRRPQAIYGDPTLAIDRTGRAAIDYPVIALDGPPYACPKGTPPERLKVDVHATPTEMLQQKCGELGQTERRCASLSQEFLDILTEEMRRAGLDPQTGRRILPPSTP